MKINKRAEKTNSAAKIMRSLGSASALRIFLLLSSAKEMCVSDIAEKIGLSMSATSHQLQRMENLGLVNPVRSGRTICYIFQSNRFTKMLTRCLKTIVLT